jgi:uncharacterized protein (TIGR03437 family)
VVVSTSTSVTNTNNTTSGSWAVNVSDADGSYRLAPGSIAAAYGQNLAPAAGPQPGSTLPTTLGGISVTVKDSAGVSRQAGLYYVGQNQVNYVLPAGTAPGVAAITVGKTAGAALIAPVAPSLFSGDSSGKGAAASIAIRVDAKGNQVAVPSYQCTSKGCSTVPMDLGASTDTLVLELYGTGIQGRSSLASVVAQIGGIPATVQYAGAQTQYDGLDQVNLFVPRTLAGAGEVPVILTVDGITANVVTVNIK